MIDFERSNVYVVIYSSIAILHSCDALYKLTVVLCVVFYEYFF